MMADRRKPAKVDETKPGDGEPSRRDRIIVEAGRLFGAKGYDGVSMRQIADAAAVQLSLIVYHFGTKENLYRSVFEYFHDIFEERMSRLQKISDFTDADAVRRIVEAFVWPTRQVRLSEEGRVYALLVLREATDPQQDERGIVRDYYDPMAKRFIAALSQAMPDKPIEKVTWAYLFAVSVLVMSVMDGRAERLSDGKASADDLDKKYRYLVDFITAGILGI